MSNFNKVPLNKVNTTLKRIPIIGEFSKNVGQIDQDALKYSATQGTILGSEINEVIGGVKALTQSDIYPDKANGLSNPAIGLVEDLNIYKNNTQNVEEIKSPELEPLNKLFSSDYVKAGWMEAKIILGTPQAIKNNFFALREENPTPDYLEQFSPSNLRAFVAEGTGAMSPTQNYKSQISGATSGIRLSTTNISKATSDILGNKNAGVTQRATLSTQNYLEEFLKNVSKDSLSEDEVDKSVDLILDGKNSEVIDIISDAAKRKGVTLNISEVENQVTNVNSSMFNSVSVLPKGAKLPTRQTKNLATIGNDWSGSSTSQSYTFERVHSVEELAAEFKSITREITETIVHWTAHFNDQGHIGARDIHKIGVNRGFNGCSYHYIIKRNGDIERGRPVNIRGAHAKAAGHNKFSIGVAFVAGYNCPSGTRSPNRFISADSITPAQFKALEQYLKAFFMVFPGGQVFGHMDFDPNKPDPGFDLNGYIQAKFNRSNVINPNQGPASPTQIASILAETTQGENIG